MALALPLVSDTRGAGFPRVGPPSSLVAALNGTKSMLGKGSMAGFLECSGMGLERALFVRDCQHVCSLSHELECNPHCQTEEGRKPLPQDALQPNLIISSIRFSGQGMATVV